MSRFVITNHGKKRLRERVSAYRSKDMNKLFMQAVRKGKSPSEFKPPFYDFLQSKLRNGVQIKVYQGMIYFYNRKKLITVYNIPQKYRKQFESDKLLKKYNIQINKLTNEQLYKQFIHSVDMFISMFQINMSINLLSDDFTISKMVELYVQIRSCIKIMKTRTRITSYKSRIKITKENIVISMRNFINEFEELAPNIVGINIPSSINKTKAELHYDAERFTVLVENIERCSSFVYENNFFLCSEEENESEGENYGSEQN